LVRHDADERIGKNDEFDPTEPELRAFGDRIEEEVDAESLTDLEGVGEATAEKLRDAGLESVADVRAADADELEDVDGLSESLASELADADG
jgi:predicted flap endonuclease-1-like 5' DNA nuclease